MDPNVIETSYPLSFRRKESEILGNHIKNRQSVVVIGMKRVGISNFLRFFLNHKKIRKEYIGDGKEYLFIPVDLNDLVERELFPFWILTLKRIGDTIEDNTDDQKLKKDIQSLFLDAIQSQDLFLTIDNVRKALILISDKEYIPTLFFLRFDRIASAATSEFFANLQGLIDATHNRLSYVMTSVRGLDSLSPKVFPKSSVAVFVQNMYFQPATQEDMDIIYEYNHKNLQTIPPHLKTILLDMVGGYVQYLQFALVFLNENKSFVTGEKALFDFLVQDERIVLQSEELWESLTPTEQTTLLKIVQAASITSEEKEEARYLWETGIVKSKKEVFSSLFLHFLKEKIEEQKRHTPRVEYTKKEFLLLKLLEYNAGKVCEREQIIESVWPEVNGMGVSDWAIDRLVARVRSKLKNQKSKQKIVTVKTRGYKLVFTE